MNKSFTLIEILVVIVVIGIISSFIIVGLSSVSDKANIAKGQAFSNSLRNSLLMNLVSEYKFDGNINDSWGNDNGSWTGPLAPNTSATYVSDCLSEQCFSFDGIDDYITLNSPIDLSNKEFTLSFWGKELGTSSGQRHAIGLLGSDVRFGRNDNALYFYSANGNFSLLSGFTDWDFWHFYVATLKTNGAKIYKDGESIDSDSSVNLLTTAISSFTIGKYISYFWNGLIDDVRIYNAAIPNSQIKENYYSGINKLYKNKGIVLNEFNQRLTELKTNLTQD